MKKCKKHPKYNGRKQPSWECPDCFSMYVLLHTSPRMLPKPTKIIKDKTKYSRKTKHRGNNDNDAG